MTKISLILALAIGPMAAGLFAQAAKNSAAGLARIPSQTSWEVAVQPKAKPPENLTPAQIKAQNRRDLWRPPLQSISGKKAEKNLQMISTWRGGKTTEVDVVDGVVYQSSSPRYPDDVLILDLAIPSTVTMPRYDLSDFPELFWVGPDTFVESAKAGGVRCDLYRITAEKLEAKSTGGIVSEAPQVPENVVQNAPPKSVWINSETRLPVKYDDGKNIFTYRFSPSEDVSISYSEPFRKMIEAYTKARKANNP